MKSSRQQSTLDTIFAIISFLLLIIAYLVEYLIIDEHGASSVSLLIEIWKVGTSLSIAWFTQKILSRIDYASNLRERALSAYRRIRDIQSALRVFRTNVISQKETSKSPAPSRATIEFGIDLIEISVKSSILDWADVIGEDLDKAAMLASLQDEQRILELTPESEGAVRQNRLEAVKDEIDNLAKDLPYILKNSESYAEMDLPRGGVVSPAILQYFLKSLRDNSAILLNARLNSQYIESADSLDTDTRFIIYEDVAAGTSHLSLNTMDGTWAGEVLNPFDNQGLYMRDFIVSLTTALQRFGLGNINEMIDTIGVPAIAVAHYFEHSSENEGEIIIEIKLKED